MIIPIGDTCNITFLLQNAKIKKQTTLFEWFVSKKLNYITEVLLKISNNENPNFRINGKYILFDNIYSDHYKLPNFIETYIRRRNRLIETIKNNSTLLFVRFESFINNYTTEIDDFIYAIKKINPTAIVKMFFIAPKKIEHPCVVTAIYDRHAQDPYCKTIEINELFVNGLIQMGYDIDDKNNIIFDDMSII
jgi:hypothetical protein